MFSFRPRSLNCPVPPQTQSLLFTLCFCGLQYAQISNVGGNAWHVTGEQRVFFLVFINLYTPLDHWTDKGGLLAPNQPSPYVVQNRYTVQVVFPPTAKSAQTWLPSANPTHSDKPYEDCATKPEPPTALPGWRVRPGDLICFSLNTTTHPAQGGVSVLWAVPPAVEISAVYQGTEGTGTRMWTCALFYGCASFMVQIIPSKQTFQIKSYRNLNVRAGERFETLPTETKARPDTRVCPT